ncbi:MULTISPECIES: acyltransferase [Enterobacterales]|uniref:acyltransferase family protein n=1 Tax=Enterobacterales TaxID=91347 RepID=UPI002ED85976
MNKVTHLEGLRGFCCFIVVFDHCVTAFNSTFRHTNVDGVIGSVQRFIAWSPLNLIYSGIPSVYIFFILSGFVLSNKYNKHKKIDILTSASIKRYPRLIIPVFFSMVVLYAMHQVSNIAFDSSYHMTIWDVFIQSFVYVPFGGAHLENGAMWTITYELFGSFLVFAILAIFGNYKHKYIVYLVVFAFTIDSYYCIFIFGLTINSLMHDGYSIRFKNKSLATIAILISLILISFPYPRNGTEIGGIYSHLMIFKDNNQTYQSLTKAGCMLLFIGVFSLNSIISFFNTRPLQFMGKISFSVYILHVPFLVLTLNFKGAIHSQYISLIVLSVAVYLLTILTSIYFERIIDNNAVKYTNIITGKVM